MPRESKQEKRRRAVLVIDRLDKHMPGAKIALNHGSPLELLVSVILSAQCTDRRVNLVTPALFRRYPTAESYSRARVSELEGLIKSCGLYRTKARNLIGAAKVLLERHQGRIPTTRSELESLPGVGHKTAGVVCIHLGSEDAFPVDTHIRRLANRLGFTTSGNPDRVELDLRTLLPANRWTKGHQLLIWHGRRTCFARRPACERCVVADLCPKIGVSKSRSVGTRRLPVAGRARPSASSSVSGSARASKPRGGRRTSSRSSDRSRAEWRPPAALPPPRSGGFLRGQET